METTVIARAPDSQTLPVLVLKRRRGWQAIDTKELWRARDLLGSLAIRDIKLRYRQTALGVIWVVLQPVIAAGIFSFVFGTVANLPSGGVPYIVFAFTGLLGWNVFQATLTKASGSMVANAGMVQKVYFPRLMLPLSAAPGTMLDFAVGLVVMGVLMVKTHAYPGLSVLTVPVWLLLITMLALGLGFLGAATMVRYRDVAQMVPVGLQMLLYVSPIAYSIEAIPQRWIFLYSLNPLVGLLEGLRWSLLPHAEIRPTWVAYSAVVSVVMFVVGAFVFTRMERRFADVI